MAEKHDLFGRVALDASFEDIPFHVESEDTEFVSHDGVEHKAYRRPGADIEPTGINPRRGSLTCLFYNDIEPGLFPDRFGQLSDAIRDNPIGKLVHPFEGIMQAFMKVGHRSVTAGDRDGCKVKLDWVEHNASASGTAETSGLPDADTPEATAQQASIADDAMATAAPGGGFLQVTSLIAIELDKLESQFSRVAEIESSLRLMERSVTANIVSPLFAGTSGYQAVVALESLRASIVRLRTRYLPDASKISQYIVPVTMPVWAISKAVYGDATKSNKILEANAVPDPLFVAAGSVLQILPLT